VIRFQSYPGGAVKSRLPEIEKRFFVADRSAALGKGLIL
jgi:hypothetical protein